MPKMTDIAREAGVSLSTVSYALSGKRPISESTRAKVNEAIERLDFHPAAAARALALQQTSTLGLAVPQRKNVNDHVIMEFVSAILGAAHASDNDVLLVTAEDHQRTLRVAEEGKVDGLIIMDVMEDDPRVESVAKIARPTVLIGYPSNSKGLSNVDFDFLNGAALAVNELHAKGARRIAMIRPPVDNNQPIPTYEYRARLGYLSATERLRLQSSILEVPATAENVAALVRDRLLDGEKFDGLFVHHESLLPLLGRACFALDIQPPTDLQVIALAPGDVAENGPWSVSAVDLPIAEIGRRAVSLLLKRLGAPDVAPSSELIAPTFRARGTTRG